MRILSASLPAIGTHAGDAALSIASLSDQRDCSVYPNPPARDRLQVFHAWLSSVNLMPSPIPLSQPDITQLEIDAVVEVLHSKTLSIGPKIEEFERKVAGLTGRRHAIGVSSGTAGLHCAMIAAGIRSGDEVITTPFSFVASTNCILYVGARPVFADIDPRTLNLDPDKVQA